MAALLWAYRPQIATQLAGHRWRGATINPPKDVSHSQTQPSTPRTSDFLRLHETHRLALEGVEGLDLGGDVVRDGLEVLDDLLGLGNNILVLYG